MSVFASFVSHLHGQIVCVSVVGAVILSVVGHFLRSQNSSSASINMAAVQTPEHYPAGDIVVLDRENGTRVIVHLHGATVLSWQCNGEEQLFLSTKSVFDNKKAIRGGIPLVFPKFGPWSPGPQHGFARIKRWSNVIPPSQDSNGNVIAAFQLEDDEETRQMWNHKFKVVYTLMLLETSLVCNFVVHNTGSGMFDFTCLLHTYFRVPDINSANVVGLKGLTYVDKVRDGNKFTEDRDSITVQEKTDRVYEDCPKTILLQTGASHSIEISTLNFPDIVMWNPWDEGAKGMADMDDEGWRNMLCVEAGKVSSPVYLEAGDRFDSSLTMKILSK